MTDKPPEFSKKVKSLAERLYTYFAAYDPDPDVKYYAWDTLEEQHKEWWYKCIDHTLRKE